jgi:uracil phosphoribosyltransferase
LLGDYLITKAVDLGYIPFQVQSIVTPTGSPVVDGVFLTPPKTRICVVPILRAGLAFLDSVEKILPTCADVGHLVLQRDESTAEPIFLLDKIPQSVATDYDCVIVLDPMLATGGSIVSAIDILVNKGVCVDKVVLIHALAAPEGLEYIQSKYPTIKGVIGVLDSHLNDRKYIIPGLGDFGDRFY